MIGKSNDEANFSHKLLLTNAQVLIFRKAFEDNLSANIKLPRTQLHKMEQSRWFSARSSGLLIKTGYSLMKNILKPLAASVLTLLCMKYFRDVTAWSGSPKTHKKKILN